MYAGSNGVLECQGHRPVSPKGAVYPQGLAQSQRFSYFQGSYIDAWPVSGAAGTLIQPEGEFALLVFLFDELTAFPSSASRDGKPNRSADGARDN